MIDRLVDAAVPADRCCRVLGVARQNYCKPKRNPTTPTQLRRQWLTGLIREVHVASRGTYGYRRVHAELTLGMGITVCARTVWALMNEAGIYGLPGPTRVKRLREVVTADDLVNRKFHRVRPNELWSTSLMSLNTARVKGGCTTRWSSTASAAAWWGGRSLTTSAPSWSSTPCRWRSGTADLHPGRSITATTARSADSIGRRNTSITEVSHDGKWGLE